MCIRKENIYLNQKAIMYILLECENNPLIEHVQNFICAKKKKKKEFKILIQQVDLKLFKIVRCMEQFM